MAEGKRRRGRDDGPAEGLRGACSCEILHLIVSNATEIPEAVNVYAHVLLLSCYGAMTAVMLYSYSARQRRMSVLPASDEVDPRGNRVD